MKLTDLLSILFLLITILVGGYAWTEYKKASTNSEDIRAFNIKESIKDSKNITFQQAVKRTE